MKRLMTMLVMTAMVATGAHAQLNLGRIKNSIKRSAENKAEWKIRNAANKAMDTAAEKVESAAKKKTKKAAKEVVGDNAAIGISDEGAKGTSTAKVSTGKFNHLTFWKQSFEPTEEALGNDQWANNTDKLSYQTKTMKELHAAWDHLPEEYWPFHPYYTKENRIWYAYDGETGILRWMDYMDKCLKAPVGSAYQETDYIRIEGKDYYMPLDGTLRSIYTADFVCDPHGSGPFKNFARLLCFDKKYYCTEIEYQMDKPEEGLITKDWFIYKGSRQRYEEWIRERENMCLDLATEVTPIKVVQDDIIKNFEDFNGTSRAIYRLCCGIKALAVYDRILKNHKDFKEGDETNQKIKRLVTINEDKVRQMSNDYIAANKPAVAAPKGVTVDAATMAKGVAQAKEYVGADKFVKLIFESKNWRAFKEPKWPYRVNVYVVPVAIIAKGDNGKQVIHFCDLGKSPDGKTYTIQASNTKDPGPIPLK